MHLLVSLAAVLPHLFFQVANGPDPGGWPRILSSAGFVPGQPADILVIRPGAGGNPAEWLSRARRGAALILEGESEIALELGIAPLAKRVRAQSVEDLRSPKLRIVWEHPAELPAYRIPPGWTVFARERWEQAPLLAGTRYGDGAILWVATSPGARGYERFPYLVHALADLGVRPPFESRSLWAFFDSSYRLRVDLDYFARRWRASGIAGLHVAAWHYWEPDAQRDAYLRNLIAACHRNAIAVYAWFEFPHVSERFWQEHPEWREKTAMLQDAHLDWRRLMDIANPDCSRAVAAGARRLLEGFDWDGVNLAELYFESLEGFSNPARFTPMNDGIRSEFRRARGFDPLELFSQATAPDAGRLRTFLDWRAGLARSLQEHWLGEVEAIRAGSPHLDPVLTHIDDRFDPSIRDALGADAASVVPLMTKHDFTFLVEDPATLWDRGPERYPQIAERYRSLAPNASRVAIDINIVERYQDVYPTKQQTGSELFQLVHFAAQAFSRVALYFENSILRHDIGLLPAAASSVTTAERIGDGVAVKSRQPVRVRWPGPVRVDGRPWPATDRNSVLLPAGAHVIEAAGEEPEMRLLDLSADLRSARPALRGLEISYLSNSRAYAVLDSEPGAMEIDGEAAQPQVADASAGRFVIALPRGQHVVRFVKR